MSKKRSGVVRRLFELFLIAVALYLLFIAHRHPQETSDALILTFLCVGVWAWLEIWAMVRGRLHIILSFGLIVVFVVFMSCEFCIGVGARNSIPQDLGQVDYILVLGNKLEPFGLSDILKARLDKAVELSKYQNVPIIVSGGNSEVYNLSEASQMREYLINQGVQNDILTEEKASDTRQNFLYAAKLTGTESQLIVVTSEWHLFRAKMLARDMGFVHVYGIGTKTDREMYLYYNLREVVAILREILMSLLMHY